MVCFGKLWFDLLWFTKVNHSAVLSLSVMPDSCYPMDCSLPGCSVHGDSPGKKTGVVAMLFSRDLPNPGIEPRSPALQMDSLLSEPLWPFPQIAIFPSPFVY